MKLIEQSVELWEQTDMYQHIERCARVCYQSEPKDTSSETFVNKLIANKHLAMLEHGTIYLKIPMELVTDASDHSGYNRNKYSHVAEIYDITTKDNNVIKLKCAYVTTNYRVLVENGWLDDLKYYKCEPTEFHERRITLKFTTSIGIVRELLRHRKFSFANESTRYCNYSKDKFDGEITFIKPYWCGAENPSAMMLFIDNLKRAEETYFDLVKGKTLKIVYKDDNNNEQINDVSFTLLPPQQAREVLPLCTKSELVMTGFTSDWKDFLDKRLFEKTGKVHPDMIDLCLKAKQVLEDNNLWKLIYKEN